MFSFNKKKTNQDAAFDAHIDEYHTQSNYASSPSHIIYALSYAFNVHIQLRLTATSVRKYHCKEKRT